MKKQFWSYLGLIMLMVNFGCSQGSDKTAVSDPTAPDSPNHTEKAKVTFEVQFPYQNNVGASRIDDNTTTITVHSGGPCGTTSATVAQPGANVVTFELAPGECYFSAYSRDSGGALLDEAWSAGVLLPGDNTVYLTFLRGSWTFVDAQGSPQPIQLLEGPALDKFRLSPSFKTQNANSLSKASIDPSRPWDFMNYQLQWLGVDQTGNGDSYDDALGYEPSTAPQGASIGFEVIAQFTGGTEETANATTLRSGSFNLSTKQAQGEQPGNRFFAIIGLDPYGEETFTPDVTPYLDPRAIDGVTIAGHLFEATLDAHTAETVDPPSGICEQFHTVEGAQSAALAKAASGIAKASTFESLTVTYTECKLELDLQTLATVETEILHTETFSNVVFHPFAAKASQLLPLLASEPIDETDFLPVYNNAMAQFNQALVDNSLTLDQGFDMGLLLNAAGEFQRAADMAKLSGSTSNDADTVRFYGALSRVLGLALDTQTDGQNNGINNFSDVLDGFGVPSDYATRNDSEAIALPETCVPALDWWGNPIQDCTTDYFPVTAPTSGQLFSLLDTVVREQLLKAIADLGSIGQGFSHVKVDPVDASNTVMDYGDVLFLRAVAHGLLAQMTLERAYDLDLDIAKTFNEGKADTLTVQQFLADNPTIGTLNAGVYVAELTQAKLDLRTALQTMQAAVDWIEAETGDQTNHLITFYNISYQCEWSSTLNQTICAEVDTTVEDIADFRDTLAKALIGLDAPVTVDDNDTPADIADDTIIDFSKIFAGIDFRQLLPGFTGDTANGLFPDPTMGGVLVQAPEFYINEDRDGNGIPDLAEEDKFYPALFGNVTWYGNVWTNNRNESWTYNFNKAGTLTANWSITDYSVSPTLYSNGQASGTWEILSSGSFAGDLRLTFSSGQPEGLSSSTISLHDIWVDSHEYGEETYLDQGMQVSVAHNYGGQIISGDSWWNPSRLWWGETGTTNLEIAARTAFVQTRWIEGDPAGVKTNAWISFNLPELAGRAIEPWMVHNLELRDGANTVLASGPEFIYVPFAIRLRDCLSAGCAESSFKEYGFSANVNQSPSAQTYTLKAKTANSTPVSSSVALSGSVALPYVSASSMSASWNADGSLTLNWSNPTAASNWNQVQEIRIVAWGITSSQLSERRQLHLKLSPETVSTTIPAATLAAVEMDSTARHFWQIQTRAYDANGVNHARSLSGTKEIEIPPTVAEVIIQ